MKLTLKQDVIVAGLEAEISDLKAKRVSLESDRQYHRGIVMGVRTVRELKLFTLDKEGRFTKEVEFMADTESAHQDFVNTYDSRISAIDTAIDALTRALQDTQGITGVHLEEEVRLARESMTE